MERAAEAKRMAHSELCFYTWHNLTKCQKRNSAAKLGKAILDLWRLLVLVFRFALIVTTHHFPWHH